MVLAQVGCGRAGFALLCDENQTGGDCVASDGGTDMSPDGDSGTSTLVASFNLDGCNLVDDAQGLVGTPTGTLTAEADRHGVAAGACRFAADGFITVPNSPLFASPHFSVAVWLSVDWAQQSPGFGAVYMWRNIDPPGGHNLFVRNEPPDGSLEVYLMPDPMNPSGNPWNTILGPPSPQTGDWTHAVVTYDGNDIVLYIDGQEQNRLPSTYSYGHSNTMTIGAGEGYFYAGAIDDLSMFNRALLPAEVLTLSQQ